MISIQLSPLMLAPILKNLVPIHKKIKERLGELNIPVVDTSKNIRLEASTSAALFENFPIQCDHYGSSLAFYKAFCILNYFIVATSFTTHHSISFSSISIDFEDLLIINSFNLFQDVD